MTWIQDPANATWLKLIERNSDFDFYSNADKLRKTFYGRGVLAPETRFTLALLRITFVNSSQTLSCQKENLLLDKSNLENIHPSSKNDGYRGDEATQFHLKIVFASIIATSASLATDEIISSILTERKIYLPLSSFPETVQFRQTSSFFRCGWVSFESLCIFLRLLYEYFDKF